MREVPQEEGGGGEPSSTGPAWRTGHNKEYSHLVRFSKGVLQTLSLPSDPSPSFCTSVSNPADWRATVTAHSTSHSPTLLLVMSVVQFHRKWCLLLWLACKLRIKQTRQVSVTLNSGKSSPIGPFPHLIVFCLCAPLMH